MVIPGNVVGIAPFIVNEPVNMPAIVDGPINWQAEYKAWHNVPAVVNDPVNAPAGVNEPINVPAVDWRAVAVAVVKVVGRRSPIVKRQPPSWS